jgi:hypothetical protein
MAVGNRDDIPNPSMTVPSHRAALLTGTPMLRIKEASTIVPRFMTIILDGFTQRAMKIEKPLPTAKQPQNKDVSDAP